MSKKRNRPHNNQPSQAAVSGSAGNDGVYDIDNPPDPQESSLAAEPQPDVPPPDEAAQEPQPVAAPAGSGLNIDELLTFDNIRQAAQAIAEFRPEELPLRDSFVLVGKLPAWRFEELAPELLRDFGPYLGLAENGQEQAPRPSSIAEWARLILKYYPKLSGWLIQACCTDRQGQELDPELLTKLHFDEKLLLIGAVILLNFARNGALRVFSGAGHAAALSGRNEGIASSR